MDPINVTTPINPTGVVNTVESLPGLGSQDFLKLLVAQLTNQDPLDPTSNQELFQQIASIREIELSTTLTDSLRTLTGQQRFSSASSLIGQYVTSLPGPNGLEDRGVVVGVRFAVDGRPILLLGSGAELHLDRLSTIELPLRAGEALVGQKITGVDRRDPSDPRAVEGVVTGVRLNEGGEVVLELDSGDDLRLADVMTVTDVVTA